MTNIRYVSLRCQMGLAGRRRLAFEQRVSSFLSKPLKGKTASQKEELQAFCGNKENSEMMLVP